jgi:hypothetical protein
MSYAVLTKADANRHAMNIRRLFQAYVDAGFTAGEALELIKIALRDVIQGGM